MRAFLLAFLLLALASLAIAQPTNNTLVFVTSAPVGSCTGSPALRYVTTGASAGNIYGCVAGTWTLIAGGGVITQAYNTIQEDGSSLPQRSILNFTGGATCSDASPKTICGIPTIASTSNALKGDGAGNVSAVTGTGTNCVLVNGSSTSCPAATANYSQTFTTQTSVALTHSLNTTAVIVQCFSSDASPVNIEWDTLTITDANTVTVTFSSAQSGKCVVTGNLSSIASISISTTCGISGGPITGTGTLTGIETVNSQTGTSYAILNADCGKLVTQANGSAIADTIAQAGSGSLFVAGWFADVQNTGVGTITITPTTSTINGGSSLTLLTGQGVRIISDGTNYFIAGSIANGGTVQNITINNSTTNNLKCNKCSLNGTELTQVFPNAASTGTTVNKLAKLTGVGTVVIASAGDTGGVIGICTGNTGTGSSACGTSGSSEIAIQGTFSCVFDNGTTANDYVTISASVAGDCHDAGSAYPAGTQVLGRVLVTAAAGTRSMTIFGPELNTGAFARNATIPFAGCSGSTPSSAVDLPSSNPAVADCYGTSYRFGALDYDDAANETATFHFQLPTGWTGAVDVLLWGFTSGTTQSFKATVATACIATSESIVNPTFNSAQTITQVSPGTTNQAFTFGQTGVTMTGCSAGELAIFKIGRDTTDTSTALLALTEADLTIRVTPQP